MRHKWTCLCLRIRHTVHSGSPSGLGAEATSVSFFPDCSALGSSGESPPGWDKSTTSRSGHPKYGSQTFCPSSMALP